MKREARIEKYVQWETQRMRIGMERFRLPWTTFQKILMLFRDFRLARRLMGGKWERVCFDDATPHPYRAWMWVGWWHPEPSQVLNTTFEKREYYG